MSLGIAASTLVQGQAGVTGAALSGLVALARLVAPLVVLHPERRMILVGGGPSRQEGPTRPLTAAFALVGTAALVGAVAVVWWRISGGLFENPSEDDAISLAMLGLSWLSIAHSAPGGARGGGCWRS